MADANIIQTTLSLDGEKEFNNGIKAVDNNLKALSSQLKVASASYDKNNATIGDLTKIQGILSERLEEQNKKVGSLKGRLAEYTEAAAAANAKAADMAERFGKNSEEAKKAEAAAEKFQNKIQEYTTRLNNAEAALMRTENAIRNNSAEMERLESLAFEKSIDKIDESIKILDSEMAALTSSFSQHGVSVSDLEKKSELLNRQIEEQNNKLVALNGAVSDAEAAYSAAKEKAAEVTAEFGENSREAQNAQQAVDRAREALSGYTIRANEAEAALNGLNRESESTQEEIDHLNNIFADTAVEFNSAQEAADYLSESFSDMAGEVKTGIDIISASIAALAVLSAKAAIEFESAFAGVRKTVDATEEEFQALSDGLKNMSEDIPVAAGELSGLAESAGQLAIQKDNILGFTRVVADLGVTTNVAGQEGAEQIAQFANIVQMSQKDFDRLGSAIVDLGNNSATTEQDILNMSLRLAAAGSQAGMSEADILGFAAALSSVGIEAEAGGSAFSKVFSKIQLEVETGGSKLERFAEIAGMSIDEFSEKFREDAAGAVIAFVRGLGDFEKHGRSATVILDEMGISEVRMVNALKSASNAKGVFTEAIARGNIAWRENTALTKEAEERYKTTESQLELLKNKIGNISIEMGESLLPRLNDLIGRLTESEGAAKFLTEAGVFLMNNLEELATIYIGLNIAIKAHNTYLGITTALKAAAKVETLTFTSALHGMNAALAANPVGLIVIGLTALVTIIVSLVKEQQELNAYVEDNTRISRENLEAIKARSEALKEHEETAKDEIQTAKERQELAEEYIDELKKYVDENGNVIESEEQVTLIVGKLNELYPDTIELINGQIVGYNNLTGAISATTEELIRQAQVNGLNDQYMDAIDIMAGYESKIDGFNKKLIEERNALAETSNALDGWNLVSEKTRKVIADYSDEAKAAGFDTLFDAEGVYKYLKAQTKIHEEEIKLAEESKKRLEDSYADAVKVTEDYNQKFEAIQSEGSEALKKSSEDFYRDYSKWQAESSDKLLSEVAEKQEIKNAERLENIEKMNKAVEKLDNDFAVKKIKSEAEYYDRLGAELEKYRDEDSAEWWKYYDKITDYQKEQNDKKQAEQERADAEALKAQEKAASEAETAAKKAFDKLIKQYDKNKISKEDFEREYAALAAEWAEKRVDIAEYTEERISDITERKEEERLRKEQEAAKKSFDAWKNSVDGVIAEHEKLYSEIPGKMQALESSLNGYVQLYAKSTKEVKNAKGELETVEYYDVSTKALKKQIDELNKYKATLSDFQKKGIDAGLIGEITSKGIEEGAKFAEALDKLSDSELKSYNKLYKDLAASNKEFSENFYKTEIEQIETSFKNKLEETMGKIPENLNLVGQESVEGFIKGFEEKAAALPEVMGNIALGGLEAFRGALDCHSPSVEFEKAAFDTIDGNIRGAESKADELRRTYGELGAAAVKSFKESMSEASGAVDGVGDVLGNKLIEDFKKRVPEFIRTVDLAMAALEYTGTGGKGAGRGGNGQGGEGMSGRQSGGGTTVNYTQNNYSPKALDALEVYRNSQKGLQLAKVLM